jgi:heat shock protein HtpX
VKLLRNAVSSTTAPGSDQSGSDQSGSDQSGSDQSGSHGSGSDQSRIEVDIARRHAALNTRDTVVLLSSLAVVLGIGAWVAMGPLGLGWAAIAVGLCVLFAHRVPPALVMQLYRAQPIDIRQGGQLVAITAQLAGRAGLSRPPDLYVVPSLTLSAFAAGRPGHAAIAITEGLLRRLTLREIAGVLAHEAGHIGNNDLGVMALADALTRLTQALAYAAIAMALANVYGSLHGEHYFPWIGVLALYFAPTLASLLQLALSRAREYDADLTAARLTGDPLGLASALRRLERYTGTVWEDMMLPVPARRVPFPSLLRSHPDTEDRVRRLLAWSADGPAGASVAPLEIRDEPMISLAGLGPGEMHPRYRFPGVWF